MGLSLLWSSLFCSKLLYLGGNFIISNIAQIRWLSIIFKMLIEFVFSVIYPWKVNALLIIRLNSMNAASVGIFWSSSLRARFNRSHLWCLRVVLFDYSVWALSTLVNLWVVEGVFIAKGFNTLIFEEYLVIHVALLF